MEPVQRMSQDIDEPCLLASYQTDRYQLSRIWWRASSEAVSSPRSGAYRLFYTEFPRIAFSGLIDVG